MVRTIVMQSLQLFVVVAATFYDQTWAAIIVYLLAGLNLFIGVSLLLVSKEILEQAVLSDSNLQSMKKIPTWRRNLVKANIVLMVFILIAFGFWFSGCFFILGYLGADILFETVDEVVD